MPKVTFTTNTENNMAGIDAKAESGYRVLAYSGNLGGGTLRVRCDVDGVSSFVPNSKLSAATVDDNGDAITMISFSAAGIIYVSLAGATNPNVDVAVR